MGSSKRSAAALATSSTGSDCWSTKPAASETIPGFSRAVCIRWLIEEGFVRVAAALRKIGSVIVETCQLKNSERMRVCTYSIAAADRVKVG